jgi:hypothetical protein
MKLFFLRFPASHQPFSTLHALFSALTFAPSASPRELPFVPATEFHNKPSLKPKSSHFDSSHFFQILPCLNKIFVAFHLLLQHGDLLFVVFFLETKTNKQKQQ